MESTKSQVKTGRVFAVYMHETMKSPFLFAMTIFGSIAYQFAGLVAPLYLRNIFNILASHDTRPEIIHQVFSLVGIMALIYVVQWAIGRAYVYTLLLIESQVMVRLYESSFEYLIRHSHQFFISQFSGTLTRRVGRYAAAYQSLFNTIVDSFIPTAFFVCGASLILFSRNHILGIALAVWAVCFVGVQIMLSRLHRPYRLARVEQDSKMTGALSDMIVNHQPVTLFTGVKYESKQFSNLVHLWSDAQMKAWRYMAVIWGIQGFLMVLVNVGFLYGAVYFWQRGELTIGDFVLIQTYLIGAFGMLDSITRQLRAFYDSLADADEMIAILDTPHDIKDQAPVSTIQVPSGSIDFRDVTFFFNEKNPLLDHFNLTIDGGQKVALVGLSGAGKSTVTKLLLRLYDVKSGAITIDGQNIAEVTQESLRNAIAFVPQEPILFHRSLMENIRYGRRDASDAEVFEAAKQAYCHDFISALPDGYETLVGERGVKLSGGERQRVAVARAILKNAPILVLDEATSPLDSESEAMIQKALDNLMQGKTVLAIAHRLSTIMRMDRILVMERGAIVDSGTHEELLTRDGLYQKLWSIQAGGFLQDEDSEESK